MLNFREELSKIKEDKLNRVDLQEKVEDILKGVLKYLDSLSIEQLNSKVKISFYLSEAKESTMISTQVNHTGIIIYLRTDTFVTGEDAIKTSGLLKEYFLNQGYKIYNDVSSKYAFAILINA